MIESTLNTVRKGLIACKYGKKTLRDQKCILIFSIYHLEFSQKCAKVPLFALLATEVDNFSIKDTNENIFLGNILCKQRFMLFFLTKGLVKKEFDSKYFFHFMFYSFYVLYILRLIHFTSHFPNLFILHKLYSFTFYTFYGSAFY